MCKDLVPLIHKDCFQYFVQQNYNMIFTHAVGDLRGWNQSLECEFHLILSLTLLEGHPAHKRLTQQSLAVSVAPTMNPELPESGCYNGWLCMHVWENCVQISGCIVACWCCRSICNWSRQNMTGVRWSEYWQLETCETQRIGKHCEWTCQMNDCTSSITQFPREWHIRLVTLSSLLIEGRQDQCSAMNESEWSILVVMLQCFRVDRWNTAQDCSQVRRSQCWQSAAANGLCCISSFILVETFSLVISMLSLSAEQCWLILWNIYILA